jgi:preprotein translocase subunit SecD
LDLYAIEQEEAKQIEAEYQVINHELQQLRNEKQRLCQQVEAEMEKNGLDILVMPDFIKTAEQMQLDDPIRTIEIRVNEINSDPMVIKRNAMAQAQ